MAAREPTEAELQQIEADEEFAKQGEIPPEWSWLKLGDTVVRSDQVMAIRTPPPEVWEHYGIEEDTSDNCVLIHATFGTFVAFGIDVDTAWDLL